MLGGGCLSFPCGTTHRRRAVEMGFIPHCADSRSVIEKETQPLRSYFKCGSSPWWEEGAYREEGAPGGPKETFLALFSSIRGHF
jgi:hypothetical protein